LQYAATSPCRRSLKHLGRLLVRRLVDIFGASALCSRRHIALLVSDVPVVEVANTSLYIVKLVKTVGWPDIHDDEGID